MAEVRLADGLAVDGRDGVAGHAAASCDGRAYAQKGAGAEDETGRLVHERVLRRGRGLVAPEARIPARGADLLPSAHGSGALRVSAHLLTGPLGSGCDSQ